MKFNLTGKVPSALITSVVPIKAFNIGEGLVLPLPFGAAHKSVTLKDGSDTPLVYGTDWDYLHIGRHSLATYGIESVGSVVLLNRSLVGNVKITANYLGGCYEHYDPLLVPEVADVSGGVFTLWWDSAMDYEYASNLDKTTLPAGAIKTGLSDVALLMESLVNASPSGINQTIVESQVTPLISRLQDLDSPDVITTSKDIVGAINELLSLVESTVINTVWGHEAEYVGLITEAIDLTRITYDKPAYHRVWGSSVEVTYANSNGVVVLENLTYGDIVYFGNEDSNVVEIITGTEEPLTRLDRVNPTLPTASKDISGALLELVSRSNAYQKRGELYPPVLSNTDFTNYAAVGDYQLIPIGGNVTITGSYTDGSTSKTFTPDNIAILYPDSTIARGLVSDYPEAHLFAINPDYSDKDRTVSGKVTEVANVLKTLGPQLGHLITVVNQGVAPKGSIDLSQGLVKASENSGLYGLLSTAYGTEGDGAIMPPVAHNKPHGIFTKFFTLPDSVINGIAYNPITNRYLIHRVHQGQWTFLTSYNAQDDSYANLPTVAGIDVAPSAMEVINGVLYLAQANKVRKINLTTNVATTLYTHTKLITSLAVNTLRGICHFVDEDSDLCLVDLVTERLSVVETGIDKGLCLSIADVLWAGKGNELLQISVDKVIGRETRTTLDIGKPCVLNTLTNVALSAHGNLTQLESSGVISKLGGATTMTSLTFDSLKHGYVGCQGDSLYSLVFQKTLKNFLKE